MDRQEAFDHLIAKIGWQDENITTWKKFNEHRLRRRLHEMLEKLHRNYRKPYPEILEDVKSYIDLPMFEALVVASFSENKVFMTSAGERKALLFMIEFIENFTKEE